MRIFLRGVLLLGLWFVSYRCTGCSNTSESMSAPELYFSLKTVKLEVSIPPSRSVEKRNVVWYRDDDLIEGATGIEYVISPEGLGTRF